MVVGLVAVGYTKLYDITGEWMMHGLQNHPLIMLLAAPLLFVLSWWLVQRFAPAAAGSGIPQVIAAIEEGPETPDGELGRLLGFRVMVVKMLSSLLCLLGGGVIGREGPTIQIGASIFCTVHRRFGRLVHQLNPIPWIIAGSAAGLAAAFNTPLGGIVFAIEELASIHFNKFKIAVLSSVIIAGMMAQWILGPYLFLGFFAPIPITLTTFGWMIMISFVSGVAGAYFGKLLHVGSKKILALSMRSRLLWAALCAVVVICLGIASHSNALQPGPILMREILTSPETILSWPMAIARYLAMFFSYLSGCAGGIFSPSIAMGSVIGAQLARIWDPLHLNLLSMAGMTAFLAAVTRSPFTSAVLVLEMTNRYASVFPLMCAALFAHAVAFMISKDSFYRQQMQFYYRYLGPNPPSYPTGAV